MALVKCKECGEDVSTTAKACPKCGAAPPKRTSVLTWLVLIFFIFVFIGAISDKKSPSSTTNSKPQVSNSGSVKKSPASPTKAPVVPPKPSWRVTTSKDEMTGEASAYAVSPTVPPTKPMSFPYQDVQGFMAVGCDAKDRWSYFGFTTAPNLTNDETEDGYNVIKARIKWDDSVQTWTLTQDWGDKFLHFRDGNEAIAKISASSVALLELGWHGQSPVIFEFSLNGASNAISEITAKCAAK